MPSVRILNSQNPALDKTVEFDPETDTLADIIKKYDPSETRYQYRVAVGGEIFKSWNVKLETCLLYGDAVQLSRYSLESKENEINIMVKSYNGKTIVTQVKPNSSIELIKQFIQLKERIPPDHQRLIYAGHQLDDEKTLADYGIGNESTIHLTLRLYGSTTSFMSFVDLEKSGQRISGTAEGPEWRQVKPGLSVEGVCQNENCEAFNSLVIINMGLPICYRLGMAGQKATNCPMCKEHVHPLTCGFYKCSFRYVGVMDSDQGPKRVKSEWLTEQQDYYRFNQANESVWLRF